MAQVKAWVDLIGSIVGVVIAVTASPLALWFAWRMLRDKKRDKAELDAMHAKHMRVLEKLSRGEVATFDREVN